MKGSMIPFILKSITYKLTYNIGKQTSDFWGRGRGKDELQRGVRKLLEKMEMFCILIVVVIWQGCACQNSLNSML